jgi:hypothetical protein
MPNALGKPPFRALQPKSSPPTPTPPNRAPLTPHNRSPSVRIDNYEYSALTPSQASLLSEVPVPWDIDNAFSSGSSTPAEREDASSLSQDTFWTTDNQVNPTLTHPIPLQNACWGDITLTRPGTPSVDFDPLEIGLGLDDLLLWVNPVPLDILSVSRCTSHLSDNDDYWLDLLGPEERLEVNDPTDGSSPDFEESESDEGDDGDDNLSVGSQSSAACLDEDYNTAIDDEIPDEGEEPPDDPGSHNGHNLPEHPTLRDIYISVFMLSVFEGLTERAVSLSLRHHQRSLLAQENLDPNLRLEIERMAITKRSLEQRLGMNINNLIVEYPICPDCGQLFSLEDFHSLGTPACTNEGCDGIIYNVKTANKAPKRSPFAFVPHVSLKASLELLFLRPGMEELVQHWRNADDAIGKVPLMSRSEWLESVGVHTLISDITEGWAWRAEPAYIERVLNEESGCYEDILAGNPVRLSGLEFGLNLSLNFDG